MKVSSRKRSMATPCSHISIVISSGMLNTRAPAKARARSRT